MAIPSNDTAQRDASTSPQDPWTHAWWYQPRWRYCLGGAALLAVVSLYAHTWITEGEPGVFGFLLIGVAVLIPLERIIPRHPMKILRPQWMTDLFHVFMTSFLSVLPLFVIFPLLEPLRNESLGAWIQSFPQWAQILMALFATEFLIYWGHRFSHTIPFLWRFHAVHHSIEHLDWIAGERRHPVDGLCMAFFVGVPLLVAGFDLVDLVWVGVFNSLWDTTIHANLGWRLKFMDRIWVSTEYHHWHHSEDLAARDTNFAGALPIWDILFGTYYLPDDKQPGPYGIDTHMPEGYLGQLIQPFRPMQPKTLQGETSPP